jgi:putative SOS response-associated peptidase YedK
VPMWVYLKSREPFGLAGLRDAWRKPDGKRVESFTIVTTEPNELLRTIHNRMPLSSDRKTKSNGLTLLERLSSKPSHC